MCVLIDILWHKIFICTCTLKHIVVKFCEEIHSRILILRFVSKYCRRRLDTVSLHPNVWLLKLTISAHCCELLPDRQSFFNPSKWLCISWSQGYLEYSCKLSCRDPCKACLVHLCSLNKMVSIMCTGITFFIFRFSSCLSALALP